MVGSAYFIKVFLLGNDGNVQIYIKRHDFQHQRGRVETGSIYKKKTSFARNGKKCPDLGGGMLCFPTLHPMGGL